MEKLKTDTMLSVNIDGIDINYGYVPSGVIPGWNDIVYFFITHDCYDKDRFENVVETVVKQFENQSYDHGAQWRHYKKECVVWGEYCQIALVSFYIRDSLY
jgi:hypothetical protein